MQRDPSSVAQEFTGPEHALLDLGAVLLAALLITGGECTGSNCVMSLSESQKFTSVSVQDPASTDPDVPVATSSAAAVSWHVIGIP